jgi:hypothetical protein
MSTRTVIEINHDYLSRLIEHPDLLQALLRMLRSSEITGMLNAGAPVQLGSGVTVWGQRHHSETLKLVVK